MTATCQKAGICMFSQRGGPKGTGVVGAWRERNEPAHSRCPPLAVVPGDKMPARSGRSICAPPPKMAVVPAGQARHFPTRTTSRVPATKSHRHASAMSSDITVVCKAADGLPDNLTHCLCGLQRTAEDIDDKQALSHIAPHFFACERFVGNPDWRARRAVCRG